MDKDMGLVVKKMPGVELKVKDKCNGCGKCKDICFVKAIKIEDGVAKISNECRGCGRCAEICPNQAIELKINNEDFIEKTIKRINSSVDVT
jgi:MinD superfamily P-loop ATPase